LTFRACPGQQLRVPPRAVPGGRDVPDLTTGQLSKLHLERYLVHRSSRVSAQLSPSTVRRIKACLSGFFACGLGGVRAFQLVALGYVLTVSRRL
jgi:hypothetical protein